MQQETNIDKDIRQIPPESTSPPTPADSQTPSEHDPSLNPFSPLAQGRSHINGVPENPQVFIEAVDQKTLENRYPTPPKATERPQTATRCNHPEQRPGCNEQQFKNPSEHKRHMDWHDRPYACPECDIKPFTYQGGLTRHQREVHQGKEAANSYLCIYQGCSRGLPGKGFKRAWNLHDHRSKVHQISKPERQRSDDQTPSPGSNSPRDGSERSSKSPRLEQQTVQPSQIMALIEQRSSLEAEISRLDAEKQAKTSQLENVKNQINMIVGGLS
jgi:hypothetical protein